LLSLSLLRRRIYAEVVWVPTTLAALDLKLEARLRDGDL
jgi:hypothetical protein